MSSQSFKLAAALLYVLLTIVGAAHHHVVDLVAGNGEIGASGVVSNGGVRSCEACRVGSTGLAVSPLTPLGFTPPLLNESFCATVAERLEVSVHASLLRAPPALLS